MKKWIETLAACILAGFLAFVMVGCGNATDQNEGVEALPDLDDTDTPDEDPDADPGDDPGDDPDADPDN